MEKKFDHNGFEDKNIENNLNGDEILIDEDDLHDDNIDYRRDYDEYYKKVIEEAVSDLNKKNRKKNKILFTAVTCASLFAFSCGLIANNHLNNRVLASTQDMKYELNNKDNNQDKDKLLRDEELNNKEDKVEKKENLSIEEVVKLVSPSVVTITVTSQGNMFTQPKSGVGTGFIVDENGTVVTNYHVIEGATSIVITFKDGTEVTGKVIATSKKDDLAILDIVEEVEVPGIAELSQDDELNAGQEIVAIGNPLGKEFSGTVTRGIISAPTRRITMDGVEKEFIQIDAAINPGNSGGPLINLKGEIIGVNTAKQSGENVEGIGFAVSIKYVRAILENPENYINEEGQNSLGQYPDNYQYGEQPGGGYQGGDYPYGDQQGGYPFGGQAGDYSGDYPYGGNSGQYPYGGYSNEEQYRGEQNSSGIKLGIQIVEKENQIVVVGVEGGSVAERTGIQVNDIIVGIKGVQITSANELKAQLSLLQSGDSIELNVQRNGEVITLSAII